MTFRKSEFIYFASIKMMLHQLHMFYKTEEIFSSSGGMVIFGAILVCTKVQSAVSYFVLFDYNKAEEQGPTGGVDISNQHLPSMLYSSPANKKPPCSVYHYE
jgi:hypothetical protein